MGLKRVTAPASEPVTLDEAKSHLRVEFSDDDVQIQGFISAAVDELDGPGGYLGRALVDQTWDLYLDAFPPFSLQCQPERLHHSRAVHSNAIEIPLPPLIEVIGVFHLDGSGNEQEMPADSYTVDDASEPARIVPSSGSWPSIQNAVNAVRIRFRAGYLDQGVSPAEENVPSTIKAAILLFVGDLYANRESVVIGQAAIVIPGVVERLLRRKRFYLGMA